MVVLAKIWTGLGRIVTLAELLGKMVTHEDHFGAEGERSGKGEMQIATSCPKPWSSQRDEMGLDDTVVLNPPVGSKLCRYKTSQRSRSTIFNRLHTKKKPRPEDRGSQRFEMNQVANYLAMTFTISQTLLE